jgi:hypothetical protein
MGLSVVAIRVCGVRRTADHARQLDLPLNGPIISFLSPPPNP